MRHDCNRYKRPFGKKYNKLLKRILEKARLCRDHASMQSHVREAFRKVLECRTPALGAEVFASKNGELIVYHT
jgi:hypothetical protein